LDSGAALSNSGKIRSGMGVVFQEYDNDGLPDLLVTQLPHEPYVVFHFTMMAKVCSARENWKQDLVVCPGTRRVGVLVWKTSTMMAGRMSSLRKDPRATRRLSISFDKHGIKEFHDRR
jgi:hypothetical protein